MYFKLFPCNLASVRISLLFPINEIKGLSEKIASTPSHNLQLFHLPSLRVASYICFSLFLSLVLLSLDADIRLSSALQSRTA